MSFPFVQPYFGLGNSLQTAQGSAGGAAAGGWVELGRTSGSRASGATLDVSSLPDKRYYMVLNETQGSSTHTCDYRLNADSGTNYAYRANQNGTSETTNTSASFMFGDYGGIPLDKFSVSYFANLDTKEKLGISHQVRQQTAGASTAPTRAEYVNKHAQTSNPISTISLLNRGPNTSASGEIVVLGWDPDDTHTTNFWEELASVDLSGGVSDTISSGTFTAKKYLWVQCYLKANAATPTSKIRVGNTTVDSGTNYAERYSVDGGADGTVGSIDELDAGVNIGTGESEFHNMFIVNNASNEKLMIHHRVGNNAGTGAATAPNRRENVFKWANTSNQINILQFKADSGTYTTNSILKVWGSD